MNTTKKQMSRIAFLLKSNKDIAIFLMLMVVFRSSFADINRVPTGSMQPTIVEGDRIVVNKLAYDIQLPLIGNKLFKLAEPKRGDVVIFNSEVSKERLVKRIIGVPGDHVSMLNNQLTVNGRQLTYSLIVDRSDSAFFSDLNEDLLGVNHAVRLTRFGSHLASFSNIVIPEDYFLALGDNRDNSADSRVIGLIPRSEIIGRSQRVFMSLDPNNYYLPRGNRFFKRL